MTAIIILNYNSKSDTINCIKSILTHNTACVKFIVVDNGSIRSEHVSEIESYLRNSFDSFKVIRDIDQLLPELPEATLITSQTNDGYARGNNKGLQFAFEDDTIDKILILNNDTLFIEDIIPGLIKKLDSLDDGAFITPLIVSKDGEIDHTCARFGFSEWDIILPFLTFKRDFFHCLTSIIRKNKILIQNPDLIYRDVFPIYMPSGAFMLINKDTFQRLGGFDPNTFLYFEEPILAKKIERIGLRNYCVPSLKCVHLGGSSTSKAPSTFIQQCNMESADYFLNNYCNMNWIHKTAWWLCKFAWRLKWSVYK